ncbi:S41 family peptidase [Altererythrobacter lutimaris]|uniref:Tail specific protease domain-containing protein n=1 Tax=Altererythrobacter lutimaris TaxID=2743979 RepID=A0A850HAK2_9SPHN|nr:S41 family peptidase [Altererythrobacter lutimaris]NVE94001.1 hypothetical protein [Altererythrobacter lutimaris]
MTFIKNGIGASLLTIAVINMPVTAFAQTIPENGEAEASNRIAGYHADLRELGTRIKAEHPRPFRTLTEADFDDLVEREVAKLNSASTRADFLWAMSHVIASIGCGHSGLPYFNQQDAEIELSERFPLKTRFYRGRLYVFDPMTNADRVAKGQEIVSINGLPVPEIQATIFSRMGSDAHLPNLKEPELNNWASSYLTYALGFPAAYAVTLRGQSEPIDLTPLDEFSFEPIISPLDPCQDELCYEMDEQRNLGIATLNRLDYYGGDRATQFVEWWASVMEDLQSNDRDGLLIDMRGVGGGSGAAGSYILRHLADQPFTYFSEASDPRGPDSLFLEQQPIGEEFKGTVFIMSDGRTMSAVSHFYAVAQSNDIATIVGEPSGGGKSTNDGKETFTSSNEGVEYRISRMVFEVEAPQLSIDEEVRPDITVTYSLKDMLDRTDTMRERALDLLDSRIRRDKAEPAES